MLVSCAHRVRNWWPALIAGSLAVLGACSGADEEAPSSGSTTVEQAHAAYSALAAAQAAHDEKHATATPTPDGAPGALVAEPPPASATLNLYEVGAQSFFLDRAEAIGLGTDAIGELAAIKEKAVLARLATQHELDAAEQHLRMLASADTPDPAEIDRQIAAIGRLGMDQRMAYVRAVGRAIAVLDDAQRSAVVAPAPPSPLEPK